MSVVINPEETWTELAQRIAAEIGAPVPSDEEADFLLWERTAFPFAGPDVVAAQLAGEFLLRVGERTE